MDSELPEFDRRRGFEQNLGVNQLQRAVGGERRRRLPDRYPYDWKSLGPSLIEDELGNMFHCRVVINYKHRFTELLKWFKQRIIVPKDHLMIQLTVDPSLDNPLDLTEIAHHLSSIKRLSPDLDLSNCVVPVGMLTDPLIVQ